MVNKKKLWIFAIIFLILLGGVLSYAFFFNDSEGEFSTKTVLIKSNVPVGSSSSTSVKIQNQENYKQDFELSFSNLKGLVSAGESMFSIPGKEEKEVMIYFNDTIKDVGIHTGELIINNWKTEKRIPIVLGIEDERSSFSIIQTPIPKYENVYKGGKLGVDVKTYYLGSGEISESINAKYEIRDLDDQVLWSNEGDLILGSSWSQIVPIDKTWEVGEYVFITEMEYNDVKSVSGYLFTIQEKNLSLFEGEFNWIFAFFLVFIVGVLVLFLVFVRSRDKLFLELRKQQNQEIKRNVALISKSKKELSKTKDSKSKKKKIQELEKSKKHVVNRLKRKQKAQRHKLKKLKKEKKKPQAKKKLEQWKKQGYEMDDAEKEIKNLSGKQMSKKLDEWKKQGFKE